MIRGTNVFVSGGTFNINDPETATEIILRTFADNYVQSATHDNNDILELPKCHPGTRTSFLAWLHGPAGAGKSAIARSLAESLDQDSSLAGSFFFFRMDSKRSSEKPFVMTLAYQISRSIPETLPYIAKAVQDDPTVTSRSLETQFKNLIIQPLVQINANKSESLPAKLVIIDGLDECAERHARNLILKMVFGAQPYLHGLIRFLVVSRPEYDIQRSFDSVDATIRPCINTMELQENLQAYEDVRKYLRDKFHQIKQIHPLRDHFPQDWPSADAIEQLVEKSSGHFIYASTVIKYIENDFNHPQERLDIIVNLRATSHNPYGALDALYLNILTSAKAGCAILANILSIVVLDALFNNDEGHNRGHLDPVEMTSVQFIESVLSLPLGAVQLALLDLKSLVGVKETIEFWHKSFPDFLLDSSRSKEFHASAASAYTLIAKGCLRLLSDQTGLKLLERLWSDSQCSYPSRSLKCHHLLSLCCARAVVDHDLQTDLMEYKFNLVIPPYLVPLGSYYFWVFCSSLRNYRRASIFKETKVFEHLQRQFDHYLISELRSFVPLESEFMDVLRATISPHCVQWDTYKELTQTNRWQMVGVSSYFLRYIHHWQGSNDGDDILCEFFYSKDRACEYYLGESPPKPPSLKRKSSKPQSNTSTRQLEKRRLR